MADEARETGTRQAMNISDAETEITVVARRAALNAWSDEKFRDSVDKIITECENNATESLKSRIRTPLREYAQRQYNSFREIVLLEAVILGTLRSENTAEADAIYRKEVHRAGTTLAFSKAVQNAISSVTVGGRTYITSHIDISENKYALYSEKVGMPLEEWHKTYTDKVEAVYRNLVARNAQEDYDSNVSLRNIAEMQVRYDYNMGKIERLKAAGENLVWIEPHVNCSKRCAPYQGRLYSLDGTSGKIDGIPYVPLTEATDNPRDRYVTQSGKVYQNGCITGFNCRHRLVPYRKGQVLHPIPKYVTDAQRKINDTQRAYERSIRRARREVVARTGSPDAANWRQKGRVLYAEYRKFCKDNDVAYYPDRLRIIE